MSSYADRVLRVNLTNGKTAIEPISECLKREFVGGRGFGIRYLFDELPPRRDPLGPENKLLFLTGVLCGTSAQGFSKWMVMTKSPLTGAVARSICGGNFGAALKAAGFDLLIVEGQADRPSYVLIERDAVYLVDAERLWGLNTDETQVALKGLYGANAQIACIGPAGENLVRYAAIAHERRTASRCGVGTVMGGKRLKAIVLTQFGRAYSSGSRLFDEAVKRQIAVLKTHPRRIKLTQSGTITLVEIADRLGCFPTHNFQEGRLAGVDKLYSSEFARFKTGNFGCYSCMTRCGQSHKIDYGDFRNTHSDGPEYETIWAFGGQVGNNDIGFILAAEAKCDLLGLDTISTGNAIGFACELQEKGIISTSETDGLRIEWGNAPAFLELIERIARRRGFGAILAEGVKRAAKMIGRGADRYAMHVKGLELPAYEPRAIKGYGLSYATSNIGGSHMYGRPRQELYGHGCPRPVDRFAEEGKGDIIALVQKEQAIDEVMITCSLANSGLTQALLADLLVGATGRGEFSEPGYLDTVGERIVCLERAFNIREGFSRTDDTLPHRMFTEPLRNAGEATGQCIKTLDAMLDEYYEAFGYTRDGVPTMATLGKLGLSQIAEEIYCDR